MISERENILKFMLALDKIDGIYYSLAKKIGINENEFTLFYALADEKEHTQWQISHDWGVPRTTINSVTKKFAKMGYIELEPIGHKEKAVVLTPEGKEYMNKILAPVFSFEHEAFIQTFGKFSDEVIETVDTFANNLEHSFLSMSKGDKTLWEM